MVSMALACLAAVVMIGINEIGYRRSAAAVQAMEIQQRSRSVVHRLMLQVLDAETSQRGYLLTGDASYLPPYTLAIESLQATLRELHQLYDHSPRESSQAIALSQAVVRKLSEMDLSIRLRKQDQEDAWRFVIDTDIGRRQMEEIRAGGNELLRLERNDLLRAQAQIRQSLVLSRIGIALVAVVALMAFFMYLRQTLVLKRFGQREQEALEKERDRLGEQVRERTATLAELATHLQQVREEERSHLARELHDELGSLLTAAKLDVARLKSRVGSDSPEVAERIEHLAQTLNSGIALKRRIIEDLRPSSLSNLGLVAALEILTGEFRDHSGMQVASDIEPCELDESTELTIYRMVQESLTNIGKYAQAQSILVTLHAYADHVEVQVRDDGQGFDPAAIDPSSHGLAGMRHRVEALGGKLFVDAAPGRGTLVRAVLPRAA
ncbi:MAG: CHASE3 domain-containing protein [Xylophilus ampelinus]